MFQNVLTSLLKGEKDQEMKGRREGMKKELKCYVHYQLPMMNVIITDCTHV